MDGELSIGENGGDDNRGQRHGKSPSGGRGPAGLTCVTDHSPKHTALFLRAYGPSKWRASKRSHYMGASSGGTPGK
jgi:hypothetical protein